jgi:hypothetical protein
VTYDWSAMLKMQSKPPLIMYKMKPDEGTRDNEKIRQSIPFPRYDVWRCTTCERIYVFDGDAVIKTYVLENDD